MSAEAIHTRLQDLVVAIRADTTCGFLGVGDGLVRDEKGRTCVAILVPLTEQQMTALRKRVPEVRALENLPADVLHAFGDYDAEGLAAFKRQVLS